MIKARINKAITVIKKFSFLKFLIPLLLLITFSNNVFAAGFTATVDKTNVALNETINLTLTLRDVKGGENPALSMLERDSITQRSSQSSNISFINGKRNVTVSWNLQILPKSAGVSVIPAISVRTNNEVLRTQEIKIQVSNKPQENKDIRIVTSISKTNPYVNESLIYKLQIISTVSFSSNEFQLPKSPDFILEQF